MSRSAWAASPAASVASSGQTAMPIATAADRRPAPSADSSRSRSTSAPARSVAGATSQCRPGRSRVALSPRQSRSRSSSTRSSVGAALVLRARRLEQLDQQHRERPLVALEGLQLRPDRGDPGRRALPVAGVVRRDRRRLDGGGSTALGSDGLLAVVLVDDHDRRDRPSRRRGRGRLWRRGRGPRGGAGLQLASERLGASRGERIADVEQPARRARVRAGPRHGFDRGLPQHRAKGLESPHELPGTRERGDRRAPFRSREHGLDDAGALAGDERHVDGLQLLGLGALQQRDRPALGELAGLRGELLQHRVGPRAAVTSCSPGAIGHGR